MIPYGQVSIYLEDFFYQQGTSFARSLFISFIAYPSVLNKVLVRKPALKSIKLELVVKPSFGLNWSFFIQNWLKVEEAFPGYSELFNTNMLLPNMVSVTVDSCLWGKTMNKNFMLVFMLNLEMTIRNISVQV